MAAEGGLFGAELRVVNAGVDLFADALAARASSHSVPPVKRPSTWPTRERPPRGRAKPGRGRPSARTHPSAAASSVVAMTTPGGGVPCQPGR